MIKKKPLRKVSKPTTQKAARPISEAELRRRIAAFRKRTGGVRIAGPDDPIYKAGLTMTSVRRMSSVEPKDR